MNFLLAFLISLFFSVYANATDAIASKNKSEINSTTPIRKATSKSWAPLGFIDPKGNLPTKYTGLNSEKFFTIFKQKITAVKKGDFETSDQFLARSEKIDDIIFPISTLDTYAFRIPDINIEYDADSQAYIVGGKYGFSCNEADMVFIKNKDWNTCRVVNINREKSTYIASNAYGAEITATRTRALDFALALHKSAPIFKSFLTENTKGSYKYNDKIFIPIEKAKTLVKNQIAVLFIGRVADAKIIDGKVYLHTPTMDDPWDAIIIQEAIPFHLTKIIYYVFESGEILSQRDLEL